MGQDVVGRVRRRGRGLGALLCCHVRAEMKGPLYDGQVTEQVFFHWREEGCVCPCSLGENVGGKPFCGGRFFTDMKKGGRGMRKRLCGIKWAYWGKVGAVEEENGGETGG
ncbi:MULTISPECIES: hypothetical protein [Bartonella]|uniref:hypothetical protein n=1 Tax=Bartonella TaxID=773 RepID=UPI002363008B|nr:MULTISPECIES: hypothetical protein [Bartonella]